jgi:hypothetical protein
MYLYLLTSLASSFLMSLWLGLRTRKYLWLAPSFIIGGFFGLGLGIAYVKITPLPAWIANLSDLLVVRPLLPHILIFSPIAAIIGGAIGVYMGKRRAEREQRRI